MANVNHFAISAALGSTIGPRVAVPHGQIASGQLASTIANLRHRRRHLWTDEFVDVHDLSEQYLQAVKAAFLAVREEQSVERVIVDSDLNQKFIDACHRDFGLESIAFRLNLALMGLRKMGRLRDLHSKRTKSVKDQWLYAHASEIAARTIYFKYDISVDTMLCHPVIVKEFDNIAASLAPGFTPYEYRWTALNIRKKGASASRTIDVNEIVEWSGRIPFEAYDSVPEEEGVYALEEAGSCLLIASTEDLHESLVVGQNIARSGAFETELWQPNADTLSWRYVDLAGSYSEFRYGIVRNLVAKVHPIFNIPRGGRRGAA